VKFHFPVRETEDVDLFVGADPMVIEWLIAGIPEVIPNDMAGSTRLQEPVELRQVIGSLTAALNI
jgi:hypothetical protein